MLLVLACDPLYSENVATTEEGRKPKEAGGKSIETFETISEQLLKTRF